MRPSRICLLTPGQLATNPRLVKEADALSAAGYEVSVICTSFLDWAMQHDASFEKRPSQIAARIPFDRWRRRAFASSRSSANVRLASRWP